ncbi:MAG: hypothetical protein ACM3S2_15730 [Ignavibacteriales bacterium]
MRKIKSYNPVNLSGLVVMLLFMSITALAQDSTMMQTPSTRDQSPAIQGQSPSSQDLSFNTSASQLSNDLVKQTGLSTDKSAKISQILIDYRNNVAAAKNKYYQDRKTSDNNQNTDENQSVTGGQSKVDMNGILGDDVQQYYTGATPDLMSDYKDADKNADNDIKDVFDNDVQKSRYEQVKGQWWKDVKNKVFTSLTQNPQNQIK